MSETTDKTGFAEVAIDDPRPKHAPFADTAQVNANIERVRTKTKKGTWCIVWTYESSDAASSARRRYAKKYPDVTFASRKVHGMFRLLACVDPPTFG